MASSEVKSKAHRSPPFREYIATIPITKISLLLLLALVVITMLSCSLNLIMAFSLGRPQTPLVRLNSFSLSNFTISSSKLAAIWDANFAFFNPNLALQVSFNHVESFVFYGENEALSIASVESFFLERREKKVMQMKFATTGWEGDQPVVEEQVLKEIVKDREEGRLSFGVKMSVRGTYKNEWGWTKHGVMKTYCLGLDVEVAAKTGDASLIGALPRDCSVLMMHAD